MIKKLIKFTVLLTLISNVMIISCSATGVNNNGKVVPLGDVIGEGFINVKDLVRMKKHLADKKVSVSPAADINDDGDVTSEDMVLLKKYLLGIDTTLEESTLWSKMYY